MRTPEQLADARISLSEGRQVHAGMSRQTLDLEEFYIQPDPPRPPSTRPGLRRAAGAQRTGERASCEDFQTTWLRLAGLRAVARTGNCPQRWKPGLLVTW